MNKQQQLEQLNYLRSRNWYDHLAGLNLATAARDEGEAARRLRTAIGEGAPANVTCEPMVIWFNADGTHCFPNQTTTGKASDMTGRTRHQTWSGGLGPAIADVLTLQWGHVLVKHIRGQYSTKLPIFLIETFPGTLLTGASTAKYESLTLKTLFDKSPIDYLLNSNVRHNAWLAAGIKSQPACLDLPGLSF